MVTLVSGGESYRPSARSNGKDKDEQAKVSGSGKSAGLKKNIFKNVKY